MPDENVNDIAERWRNFVTTQELAAALDHIKRGWDSYAVGYGFTASFATDEQRAEFLAFVAHTIGYDIGEDFAFLNWEDSDFGAAYVRQAGSERRSDVGGSRADDPQQHRPGVGDSTGS